MKKIGDFFESLVVVVIIVALAHTFLEDFSILAGWTVAARRWIIWAGLVIDVIFTIESLQQAVLRADQRTRG